ncbi:hypothetical protein LOSG293_400110 [Secundilactobacillus oryzae JCM 18671]|uniref:Uncharacterized protein n=1 Tax=Secundilactobacillus oryzae JCM 18671 TaxID=1291743 RepID=A0A081BKM7_9LACO|nr:hypothetical protein [Secundilactobacillus oryzae]GAK48595.1 hypothetical protein LOSG293_400110 [Secundilactobacillus oryzae JCM 18671]
MKENLKLGDDEFGQMLLVLSEPVTEKNHKDYKFLDYEMNEIADDIWAMPAFMAEDEDFSFFFIITKIDTGDTVVAFSEGTLENGQFGLSSPLPTGEGLNMLFTHKPERAQLVLKFLNDISKANEGEWRMIEEN